MVFFHVVQYDFYKSFCIFEWCNLHSEFAKSQERKQTSFSGLRKSAEPLSASIKKPSMIEYFSFILKNKIDFSYDNFITKKISWTIKGYFKVLFLYILIVTIMTFFGINNSQKSIFNEPKVPELFKLIMIVFFMPLIEEIVFRYKDEEAIVAWQIENEVFLNFGKCPWKDIDFFEKEIETIKAIDKKRPVIITESGELSFWIASSKTKGDILGVTTYKTIWQSDIKKYISYFLPPIFYERRANLVKILFDKEVIGVELQAEPWCVNSIMNSSLEEQAKTMNLEQFRKNVDFAKRTGIKEFYFWGGEWWYYMLTTYGDDKIWNEVKEMLN